MLSDTGINLVIKDKALDFLASAGFDQEFGARPVKRAIQRFLLNDLSKKILSGSIDRERSVTVDSDGVELTFAN
jgi:ATP-dependent Clp protease ATP-binding subunit ClpB